MRYHLIIFPSWWSAAEMAFTREINPSVRSVPAIVLQHRLHASLLASIFPPETLKVIEPCSKHKLPTRADSPGNYPMSWMSGLGKHFEKGLRDNSCFFLWLFLRPRALSFRLWEGKRRWRFCRFPLRWRKGHRRFMIRLRWLILPFACVSGERSINYERGPTWLLRPRFYGWVSIYQTKR